MKIKLKSVIVISALCVSSFVFAESYNFDLGANVGRFDVDDTNVKQSSYGFEGAYYFNEVLTENVPLAEAAYLGKNSNVNASIGHFSQDSVSGDNYNAGVEFFIPESFLYVAGGISRATYDLKRSNAKWTDNDWYANIGITPIDGLLVATSYAHDQGYDANIYAKYVTDIGGDQYVNIEARYEDGDFGDAKHLIGDYYFDSSFSVGAGVFREGSNAYLLRARKFFGEPFSVDLTYIGGESSKYLSLGADFRF